MPRKQQAKWIGLDIGGANIKAAAPVRFDDTIAYGPAEAVEFPLWKRPEKLATAIKKLIAKLGGADHFAVTMTGELADCFATKREGVLFIAEACAAAAGNSRVHFYSVRGRFLPLSRASTTWDELAASNWHALGTWQARKAEFDKPGLIIDIGSTTTDIIPFEKKRLTCKGHNDTERLLAGELVYTGVERSSIAGITTELPLGGKMVPVMNELFATALDAHLLLDHLPEDDAATSTADGRPATKKFAHARLARMVGGDSISVSEADVKRMARYIADRQAEIIATAIRKVSSKKVPFEILYSGHGRFLIELAIKKSLKDTPYRSSWTEDAQVSRSLPAVAVAILAQEHFQP